MIYAFADRSGDDLTRCTRGCLPHRAPALGSGLLLRTDRGPNM
jgi:hypothetical protein